MALYFEEKDYACQCGHIVFQKTPLVTLRYDAKEQKYIMQQYRIKLTCDKCGAVKYLNNDEIKLT